MTVKPPVLVCNRTGGFTKKEGLTVKPIKIAQIGTGHDHAIYTMESMLRQKNIFEVVAVAEPNPHYFARLSTESCFADLTHCTVDELLDIEGLEAVAVETDELNLCPMALKAAEKEVAIHLDKPGGYNMNGFEELIKILKEKKLPFQIGYMYRFNPCVQKAFQIVRSGSLGEIYSIEAHMSVRHSKEKREWLGKFKGGMMYFLGCHMIDLILQFQGVPEQIIPCNCCTGAEDEELCDDYGFVMLRYKNGVSYIKTCATEVNGFARRQLVLCGTNGTIEIKPIEKKAPDSDSLMISQAHITFHGNIDPWRDNSRIYNSEMYDRYDPMMYAFAQIIRGEKENQYSYDYELELFRTVLKCCNIL